MGSIRILEQTPNRLVIADKPRISRLFKPLVISGVLGAVIIGVGWVVTSTSSYRGSLTTLECFHKEHLTCKTTTIDARGVLVNQQEISPVQKVDIAPIVISKLVCRGRGDDRECDDEAYYECQIRLHSPQTSLLIPISELTQKTSSLSEACPKQNPISSQFEQLISGVQKARMWVEDTRIGDVLIPFKRDIAAYIPLVFLGLPLLWNLLTNRQRIWTFDKLTQTAEFQTKKLLGKTTTRRFSTENLVFLSDYLTLWEKQGNSFFAINMLDYQTGDEKELALKAVEPFLSQELRSYEVGGYIFDKTPDFLRFCKYDIRENDYHGSLICSVDRLTQKVIFIQQERINELDWQEIMSVNVVPKRGFWELIMVTKQGAEITVAEFDDEYTNITERVNRVAETIADFILVPLLKA